MAVGAEGGETGERARGFQGLGGIVEKEGVGLIEES